MEKGRIPNKLKFFRQCHGYSQKKVARLLGHTNTSNICRWECGVQLPDLIQIFYLSRLYCAEPNELFDELWKQTAGDQNLLVHENEPF